MDTSKLPTWYDILVRDGWVLIPNLLPKIFLIDLKTKFNALKNSDKKPSSQILFTHIEAPIDTPGLESIMSQWLNPWRWKENSTIELCKSLKDLLFKDNLNEWLLFQEIFFDKRPGQGKFHWHQDFPFFPIDKPIGFTCWIALEKCTKENGALIIAPRSHLFGSQGSVNIHNGKYQDGKKNVDLNNFTTIQPDLEPGDALLFHPLTFHASDRNNSDNSRPGWSTVWFQQGVKWEKQNAPNHPILNDIIDKTLVKGII